MGNIPVLYQNIMFGLPSDIARDAFLWATERPGEDRMCYSAEAFAREVHTLVHGPLRQVMSRHFQRFAHLPGADVSTANQADLMRFILTRHANWRIGGNSHPSYCEATK